MRCCHVADFALQGLRVWPSRRSQALAGEDADFDLGHVQPAGVLGRVVELHAPQQPLRGAVARARHRSTS
ncbi:MAG: hypothetical protein MZW92_08405 [Comamonadaceae bacterium]|nr:hypothetical protein [Comamonadaceae bacterium]